MDIRQLVRQIIEESVRTVKIIPFAEAVELLEKIYMGGKNKDLPFARYMPPRYEEDYVITRIPITDISKGETWKDGRYDLSVNVDYAKTLISKVADLPPLVVSCRRGFIWVQDGGHRYYAFYHAGVKDVPVIMPLSHYQYGLDAHLIH